MPSQHTSSEIHKNQVNVTWRQYARDIKELVYCIQEYEKEREIKFNLIFPIIRGGLVIGVNLSHLLKDIPLEMSLTKILPKQINDNNKILIVDDCSDSGNTLSIVKRILDIKKVYFRFATLYVKDKTKLYPHFWTRKYKNEDWLVFPWEHKKEK